jgi:hypothetical protein
VAIPAAALGRRNPRAIPAAETLVDGRARFESEEVEECAK